MLGLAGLEVRYLIRVQPPVSIFPYFPTTLPAGGAMEFSTCESFHDSRCSPLCGYVGRTTGLVNSRCFQKLVPSRMLSRTGDIHFLRTYLTESIYQLVLYSQLPHTIVISWFTITD